MFKTNNTETDKKITVDINGLQSMLSMGRHSATKIGEDAGAVIRVGKRKIYNVRKIEEYMNKLSEV